MEVRRGDLLTKRRRCGDLNGSRDKYEFNESVFFCLYTWPSSNASKRELKGEGTTTIFGGTNQSHIGVYILPNFGWLFIWGFHLDTWLEVGLLNDEPCQQDYEI